MQQHTSNEPSEPQDERGDIEFMSVEDTPFRKPKFWRLSLIMVLLLFAILQNPSRAEAKAEIKTMILNHVSDKIHSKVAENDDDPLKQAGMELSMLFAPAIIDSWVNIDVTNFIAFSTFNAYTTDKGNERTIISGVILFGKVIPLNSN